MERSEMERMQRDAEKRIKEMKARSDDMIKSGTMPPLSGFVSKRESSTNGHHGEGGSDTAINHRHGTGLMKLFNSEKPTIDGDVLLIIMLVLLLSSDGSDELLLLALVYIML